MKFSISLEIFNPGGRSWIFSIFGPVEAPYCAMFRYCPWDTRLVDPCLSRRVSQRHLAGALRIFLSLCAYPCPFLFFFNSLFFFPLRGIPCFLERLPLFSRDFRGSVGIKILFFGGLPCRVPTKKTRKGSTGFRKARTSPKWCDTHSKLDLVNLGGGGIRVK